MCTDAVLELGNVPRIKVLCDEAWIIEVAVYSAMYVYFDPFVLFCPPQWCWFAILVIP